MRKFNISIDNRVFWSIVRSSVRTKIALALVIVVEIGALLCLLSSDEIMRSVGANLVSDAVFAGLGYFVIALLINKHKYDEYRAKNNATEKRVHIAIHEAMTKIMVAFERIDKVYLSQMDVEYIGGSRIRYKFQEFVEEKAYLTLLNGIDVETVENIERVTAIYMEIIRAFDAILDRVIELEPGPRISILDKLLTKDYVPHIPEQFAVFMTSGEKLQTEYSRDDKGYITNIGETRVILSFNQRMGEFSRFVEERVEFLNYLDVMEYDDLVTRVDVI